MRLVKTVQTIIVMLFCASLLGVLPAAASGDGFYQLSETAYVANGGAGDRLLAETADYKFAYGDEQSVAFTLPWAFRFYGQDFTQITADSNGNLWFGAGTPPTSFNLATVTQPVISAWHTDLDSYYHGGVFVRNLGDRVVVEWRGETFGEAASGRENRFAVVLFANGDIRLDYGTFATATLDDAGSGLARGNGVDSLNLTGDVGLVPSLAGRSFLLVRDIVPPVVTIDPVTSPTLSPTQTLSGTMEVDAVVTVTASTAATVGPVSYPTAGTWSCAINGLSVGDNTLTVTASDRAGNAATIAPAPAIAILADSDGDGVGDYADLCNGFDDRLDADADGLADGCDDDDDGDLLADANDNCPLAANADQADFDQDGIGNVCDPETLVPVTATVDGEGFMTSDSTLVNYGASATFTITPATGYRLEALLDNGISATDLIVEGSYTIVNVTAQHSLVATFVDDATPLIKPQLAAGANHSLALLSDGTLMAWGYSTYGALGIGPLPKIKPALPVHVPGVSGVVAIAAGGASSYALLRDGSVLAWGYNASGQLGNGTTINQYSPIAVLNASNVVAIAAGGSHVVALKSDGTLLAWGNNSYGQLGNNTTDQQTSAIVVPNLQNVSAISAGSAHTVALISDGSVKAWGQNNYGQLGDRGTYERHYPVFVHIANGQYLWDVIAIAAGGSHTLAIKRDGTLMAWGRNSEGQLGDGTITQRTSATQVSGLNDVVAIAAGNYHSLALMRDGTVRAWGFNGNSQLGYTTSGTSNNVPTEVPGANNVEAIAAGSIHTLTLTSEGRLLSWGWNVALQLGDGTRVTRPTPTLVPAEYFQVASYSVSAAVIEGSGTISSEQTTTISGTKVTLTISPGVDSRLTMLIDNGIDVTAAVVNDTYAIDIGGDHIVAGTFSATQCRVISSVIGAGSITPQSEFVNLGESIMLSVSAREGYRLEALLDNGISVTERAVGNLYTVENMTGNHLIVAIFVEIGAPPVRPQIATGGLHSVLLKDDGTVLTWGDNAYGQLGDGTTIDRHTPKSVPGLHGVVAVAAGQEHSVALRRDGTVLVWGRNAYYQVGDGTRIDRLMPRTVPGLIGVTAIASMNQSVVALMQDGTVKSWGTEFYGSSPLIKAARPVERSAVLTDVRSIASGSDHTLVLKGDGTVWVWGDNKYGQCGVGTSTAQYVPVQVPGVADVVSLSAGSGHSVALARDGKLSIWGDDSYGQIGDGGNSGYAQYSPIAVANLDGIVAVGAGSSNSLALTNEGRLQIWGGNYAGQLGLGMADPNIKQGVPVTIPSLNGVVAIQGRRVHLFAIKSDGSLWAWGSNNNGQLGDGTTDNRSEPIQVPGISLRFATYQATASVLGGNGTVTPANAAVMAGGRMIFDADPAAGYHVATLSDNGVDVTASVFNNSYLVGDVSADHAVVVSFAINTYSLAATADGSGGGITPVSTNVTHGDSVAFALTVAEGHHLASLFDNGVDVTASVMDNNYVLESVAADHGLVATFAINTYNMATSVASSGGAIAPDNSTVTHGGSVTFTLAPEAGYRLVSLLDNGTPVLVQVSGNRYVIDAVDRDHEVVAVFADLVTAVAPQRIAEGYTHSLVIRSDGTLWAMGSNANGELGLGSTGDVRLWPTQVGTFTDWRSIVAGAYHSVALRNDGSLWAWGAGWNGQLGAGNNTSKNAPQPLGTVTDWVQIAAGNAHNLALKSDGSLWAWGNNNYGQLGYDSAPATYSNSPVQIGSDRDWVRVACGFYHSVALKADGSLWVWGRNDYGQLGDGTKQVRSAPVRIGTENDWLDVAAGYLHTLALKADGRLYAWGDDVTSGQLGNGTSGSSLMPLESTPGQKWMAIAAGVYHSLAIRADGTLWGWGRSFEGQAGSGKNSFGVAAPEQVGTANDWVQIGATNGFHSHGLRSDGTIWVWGRNDSGQLGVGDNDFWNVPTGDLFDRDGDGVSLLTDLCPNTATNDSDGDGSCDDVDKFPVLAAEWLDSDGDGLGDNSDVCPRDGGNDADGDGVCGNIDNCPTITNLDQLDSNGDGVGDVCPAPAISGSRVAAGSVHTLAIGDNGTLWAWGRNANGQLGNGGIVDSTTPLLIGSDSDWAAVKAGFDYSLALKADGSLWAWGGNVYGQLGDGSTTQRPAPVRIGTDNHWMKIETAYNQSFALKSDGTLWVWGYNGYGLLGLGNATTQKVPVQLGSDSDWVDVSSNRYHTVALKADGSLWAWGFNPYGSFGDGTTVDSLVPVRIGQASDWAQVRAGHLHTSALKRDGTLWAWGYNGYGQFGNGTTTESLSPLRIGTENSWREISVGLYDVHALKSDGSFWGWGYNYHGQVGDGTLTLRKSPVRIGLGNDWSEVESGDYHSVARKADGTVWSWGNNASGQLGDGTTVNKNAPGLLSLP